MSNGKQNNRNGWADGFLNWEKNNSLAEKDDLLWEKLNLRLQPPRKKTQVNLFWAAASLLIITGAFTLWNLQFKNNEAGSLGFTKNSYVLPNEPVIKSVEAGITIINIPARQNPTIKKSNSIPVTDQAVLPDHKLIASAIQPVIADSPQTITHNPVIQQRKIRVVHINDWFSPPPPTFATSGDENEIPYTPSIWPGKHRGLSPPSSNN